MNNYASTSASGQPSTSTPANGIQVQYKPYEPRSKKRLSQQSFASSGSGSGAHHAPESPKRSDDSFLPGGGGGGGGGRGGGYSGGSSGVSGGQGNNRQGGIRSRPLSQVFVRPGQQTLNQQQHRYSSSTGSEFPTSAQDASTGRLTPSELHPSPSPSPAPNPVVSASTSQYRPSYAQQQQEVQQSSSPRSGRLIVVPNDPRSSPPSTPFPPAISPSPQPALAQSAYRPYSPDLQPSSSSSRPSTPQTQAQTQTQTQAQAYRTPFRPGFQAKGVYRVRTDELVALRRQKGEGRRLEEGRMGRRWDKLLQLHFPHPDTLLTKGEEDSTGPGGLLLRRSSSMGSVLSDFGGNLSNSLRAKAAGEAWSKLVRGVKGGKEEDVRAAEQSIVRWQEDSSVQRCPLCIAQFGLKTRKHHCRLCGRVVCGLPPTPPSQQSPTASLSSTSRSVRCSSFVMYEWDASSIPPTPDGGNIGTTSEKPTQGKIIEVPNEEDIPTILHRFFNNPSAALLQSSNPQAVAMRLNAEEQARNWIEEMRRKGVRVCRECSGVLFRRQSLMSKPDVPVYAKLHDILMQLQEEIETSLPEFQEMVLGLQRDSTSLTLGSAATSSPSVQREALASRKRLMSNLAAYDGLARRIKDLPLRDGGVPGGSADRLQRAIYNRAAFFLTEKMAILRGLGDIEILKDDGGAGKGKGKGRGKHRKGEGSVGGNNTPGGGSGRASPKIGSGNGMGTGTVVDNDALTDGLGVDEEFTERASKLAVLLEQERLVHGYWEDANSRRQFEDASSLKASLDELREEIKTLSQTK